MNKEDYINRVDVISKSDIVIGIRGGVVSFEELQKTGRFDRGKQEEVKKVLREIKEEDDAYNNAKEINRISQFNDFKDKYPNSEYNFEIDDLILKIELKEKEEKEQQIAKVKNNTNGYTIKETIEILGDDRFRQLCNDLDLNYEQVISYQPTKLNFNMIPESEDDVPKEYTDIFFWGIPSSGKTTALASIFRTINDKYVMEDDSSLDKQFGSSYRTDLVNVYKEGLGFLPARTQKDRTQYMPFLLRRRNEGVRRNRKVSFFELSGEVFEHFLEIKDGLKDKSELNEAELEERKEVEKSFKTIELLLRSNNQKIHIFFIDYNKELESSKSRNNKTQVNYLQAATTYFQKERDLFSKKTDAVYFIITKADTIKGENKTEIARKFINDNFGNFYTTIKDRCEDHSIKPPQIKLFSIGDVHFKRISKLNYKYSKGIVESILNEVDPIGNSWLKRILKK